GLARPARQRTDTSPVTPAGANATTRPFPPAARHRGWFCPPAQQLIYSAITDVECETGKRRQDKHTSREF
ncbi:MAG: hypothetical protein ACRD22_09565, partial [Terriglobia bacterium]